jgi:hypothetical protein
VDGIVSTKRVSMRGGVAVDLMYYLLLVVFVSVVAAN